MTFQQEKVGEIADELWPLLRAHYHEIARFKDIELEPDFTSYLQFEAFHYLRLYTARKDGALIGYAVFFVRTHPHFQSSLQATQDLLFIHPAHRGFGLSFLKFCEDALAKERVDVIYLTVTTKLDFSKLVERAGYSLSEKVYTKRITEK